MKKALLLFSFVTLAGVLHTSCHSPKKQSIANKNGKIWYELKSDSNGDLRPNSFCYKFYSNGHVETWNWVPWQKELIHHPQTDIILDESWELKGEDSLFWFGWGYKIIKLSEDSMILEHDTLRTWLCHERPEAEN